MIILFLMLQTNTLNIDSIIKENTITIQPDSQTVIQPYTYELDTAMINKVMQAYTPKPIKTVSNVKKWAKVGLWSYGCVVAGNVWLIIATTIILFRGK
jgi:hypothetical protein